MKVRLLPSHTRRPAEYQFATTFLVDDHLAVDAGALATSESPETLPSLRHVLLTHAHLDHVAGLPLLLSESLRALTEPVRVYASAATLEALGRHVFNDVLWPDFRRVPLPHGNGSALEFVPVEAERPFPLGSYEIVPVPVNHTAPTFGYLIQRNGVAVAFSGDTFRTDRFWQLANARAELRAVFVDVSYPSEEDALAARALHLTPARLREDLDTLTRSDLRILAMHLKPSFAPRVVDQLNALGPPVEVAEIDRVYDFGEDSSLG